MLPPRLLVLLLATSFLGAAAPAIAQTPAPATPAAAAPAALPDAPRTEGGTEQKIERIRIEDAGSRIDELRVGGETRTITVSPKGGMPAYEVQPSTANRSPGAVNRNGSTASGGNRVWNVLGF